MHAYIQSTMYVPVCSCTYIQLACIYVYIHTQRTSRGTRYGVPQLIQVALHQRNSDQIGSDIQGACHTRRAPRPYRFPSGVQITVPVVSGSFFDTVENRLAESLDVLIVCVYICIFICMCKWMYMDLCVYV